MALNGDSVPEYGLQVMNDRIARRAHETHHFRVVQKPFCHDFRCTELVAADKHVYMGPILGKICILISTWKVDFLMTYKLLLLLLNHRRQ